MIPPEQNAAFVCAMEDVLDVYQRPYDATRPVVCLDETSKQLVKETRPRRAVAPGRPAIADYEYERNGTANLFMLFEPLAGQRHVEVTARRTAQDYARVVQASPGALSAPTVMTDANGTPRFSQRELRQRGAIWLEVRPFYCGSRVFSGQVGYPCGSLARADVSCTLAVTLSEVDHLRSKQIAAKGSCAVTQGALVIRGGRYRSGSNAGPWLVRVPTRSAFVRVLE